jgi:hypothetical protein
MECTFHNSYVTLELVPSRVIFWTALKCWHKSYSKQGYAAPGLKSSLQKLYWLIVTKLYIHISNGHRPFHFAYYGEDFHRTWQWVTRRKSSSKQELLTICNLLNAHPLSIFVCLFALFFVLFCFCFLFLFFCGVRFAIVFQFLCCVYLFCLSCSVSSVQCCLCLWIV